MSRLRELLSHFGTWYVIGYLVLVAAIGLAFYQLDRERDAGREVLCSTFTTYTRALGAGRTFTRKEAEPFLTVLNHDLARFGCTITFEEISGAPRALGR